ncbi:hypothetical protein BJY00DRAFT_273123 [Aspergillus carlsbadensis]|nr:hypothetical protein BJY00DRAFT_273123 [Aspergillus carlsbadensis]
MAPKRDRSDISSELVDSWLGSSHSNTDPNFGFIESLYHTCSLALQHVWKFKSFLGLTEPQRNSFQSDVAQLSLWEENFPSSHLDTILHHSTYLQIEVLENLYRIGRILTQYCYRISAQSDKAALPQNIDDFNTLLDKAAGIISEKETSDSSTDSDTDSVCSSLTEADHNQNGRLHCYVTCLMELGPAIERQMANLQFRLDQQAIPQQSHFSLSDNAQPFAIRIKDRFKDAKVSLVERLAEASWERSVRMMTHAEEISEGEQANSSLAVTAPAMTLFKPFSMFHDSGLGTSVPARSQYAATAASHSSFLSVSGEEGEGKPRVPPLPDEGRNGQTFQCPFCGKFIFCRSRIEWKMHVFADLQAYVCTHDDCKDATRTFATRKLWASHEFTNHLSRKQWKCYPCKITLDSLEERVDHLRSIHGVNHMDLELFREHESPAENVVLRSNFADYSCPLCLASGWQTMKAYATHVGRHLEEISLACLPKLEDAGSDSDSNVSQRSHTTGAEPSLAPKPLNDPQPYHPISDNRTLPPFVTQEAGNISSSGDECDPLGNDVKSIYKPNSLADEPVRSPRRRVGSAEHTQGFVEPSEGSWDDKLIQSLRGVITYKCLFCLTEPHFLSEYPFKTHMSHHFPEILHLCRVCQVSQRQATRNYFPKDEFLSHMRVDHHVPDATFALIDTNCSIVPNKPPKICPYRCSRSISSWGEFWEHSLSHSKVIDVELGRQGDGEDWYSTQGSKLPPIYDSAKLWAHIDPDDGSLYPAVGSRMIVGTPKSEESWPPVRYPNVQPHAESITQGDILEPEIKSAATNFSQPSTTELTKLPKFRTRAITGEVEEDIPSIAIPGPAYLQLPQIHNNQAFAPHPSLPAPLAANSASEQYLPLKPNPPAQTTPLDDTPKLNTIFWEDEGTLCYFVHANGCVISRRQDNNMINGTKLLNVAKMTRGRRDSILKSEKERSVIKMGPIHLKGVWIPFERALLFANAEGITKSLYPLFEENIDTLLYKTLPDLGGEDGDGEINSRRRGSM